jgi:hypothetical protein
LVDVAFDSSVDQSKRIVVRNEVGGYLDQHQHAEVEEVHLLQQQLRVVVLHLLCVGGSKGGREVGEEGGKASEEVVDKRVVQEMLPMRWQLSRGSSTFGLASFSPQTGYFYLILELMFQALMR